MDDTPDTQTSTNDTADGPTGDTIGPPTGDTNGTATGAADDVAHPRGRDPVLLSGTEHLLAALPHVIGYHPRRSVVLVATVAAGPGTPHRRHAALTARLDLPPGEEADAAVQAFAGPLAGLAAEHPDGLLLHVFVHDAPAPEADAVAVAVWRLAGEGGHVLHDLLLVEDGRYLPLVADGLAGGRILRLVLDPDTAAGAGDEACGWRPVPVPADVPGVADLVLRGRSVLPGREDVVAGVRRHDPDAAERTRAALDTEETQNRDVDDHLRALTHLSRWVVEGQDEPDARQRAGAVLALADRTLRDAVLARWLPALFSVEDVLDAGRARELRRCVRPWPVGDAGALERLLAVAAAVPRPVAAPLLTVVGVVAWGQGEGTIANESVDLALEIDPGYRMALLVQAALEGGVPPWRRPAQVA